MLPSLTSLHHVLASLRGEAHAVSRLILHPFEKEDLFMTESDQRVRHGEQVQPCLVRSHAGPEYMREPGSVSVERPPVCELSSLWYTRQRKEGEETIRKERRDQ